MRAAPPDVKTIFGKALEIDAGAGRAAYLDEACGDDPELRGEVEELLRALDEADDFMKQPAAVQSGLVADEAPAELPGMLIGPYRLMEEIGEGGMGLVFVAEQEEPIRRKVALKLVKPGMDTREVIARFEAERQALALMDHPNIAKVLDGGETPSNRPYFVMELVEGVSITRFCDDQTLTPRQRLELFIPVCQAVQHAHQKGIIHRDLTPANILVAMHDGKAAPKVIDFGIAKAVGQQLTANALRTRVTQKLGTPMYMSPEQAGMGSQDIDTRSDIYSLGVLLYELLTGTTPFDGPRLHQAPYDEMCRIIREEEPPKPSTRISTCETLATISAQRHTEPARLCKLLRGDLDWIVMKCLEKDRTRRYETANELALDLRRYLADEPVLACPPSAGYRVRKFARRHRSGLAVAGLVLFFLVALGSVTGWAWRDRAARAVEQVSQLERAVERAQVLQTEGKRAEALAALEQARLLAREAEPAPPLAERIDALQQLLDAEGRDEAFVAEFEAIRRDEQTEVDVDTNVFSRKQAYARLREALEHYGIAIRVTPPADAASHIQKRPAAIQSVVLVALDECLQFSGLEANRVSVGWFIDVLQRADSDPWRNEVRQAGRRPAALEALAQDVDVRQQPPSFLLIVVKALPLESASRLGLARRVQFAYPGDFWANHRLGLDLHRAGKHAEALRYLTAALGLRPDNPGVLYNRGSALRQTGELEAAVGDFQRAVAVAPRYAAAYRELGHVLNLQGKLDEASEAYQEAIRLQPDNARCHQALACILRDSKRDFAGAVGHFNKALELDPKNVEVRCNLVATLSLHGNALRRDGKWEDAIASYRKACALTPKDATRHTELGYALGLWGKMDEAIEAYQEAFRVQPNDAYPHHAFACFLRDVKRDYAGAVGHFNKALALDPKNAHMHYDFGHTLLRYEKLDKAAAAFRAALSLKPDTANARDALAWTLNKTAWPLVMHAEPPRGDADRALSLARETVELSPRNGHYHNTLGMALYRLGRWPESLEALKKAEQLSAGKTVASNAFFIAMAQQKLGHRDEARKTYERAVQGLALTKLFLERAYAEDLARLHVEAEKVLELKE